MRLYRALYKAIYGYMGPCKRLYNTTQGPLTATKSYQGSGQLSTDTNRHSHSEGGNAVVLAFLLQVNTPFVQVSSIERPVLAIEQLRGEPLKNHRLFKGPL